MINMVKHESLLRQPNPEKYRSKSADNNENKVSFDQVILFWPIHHTIKITNHTNKY